MEEKDYMEIQKAGNKRPFALPENYFDDFAGRMDAMIAETPQEVRRLRIRPWMYGAVASLIGVVLLGQIYFSTNNKNEKLASETEIYDSYVLSQVNENSIVDFYLTAENE